MSEEKTEKPSSSTNEELPRHLDDSTVKPSVDNSRQEFDYLLRLFELYTTVQVEADTIYYNRTSIITLAQGLLFVAFQSVDPEEPLMNAVIASIGLALAILWLFFEQRNLIFFKGRGAVLKNLEQELMRRQNEGDGLEFFPFWSEVPNWVRKNARWYQRFSAQRIQRVLIPLLFVLVWAGVLMLRSSNLLSHISGPVTP